MFYVLDSIADNVSYLTEIVSDAVANESLSRAHCNYHGPSFNCDHAKVDAISQQILSNLREIVSGALAYASSKGKELLYNIQSDKILTELPVFSKAGETQYTYPSEVLEEIVQSVVSLPVEVLEKANPSHSSRFARMFDYTPLILGSITTTVILGRICYKYRHQIRQTYDFLDKRYPKISTLVGMASVYAIWPYLNFENGNNFFLCSWALAKSLAYFTWNNNVGKVRGAVGGLICYCLK